MLFLNITSHTSIFRNGNINTDNPNYPTQTCFDNKNFNIYSKNIPKRRIIYYLPLDIIFYKFNLPVSESILFY